MASGKVTKDYIIKTSDNVQIEIPSGQTGKILYPSDFGLTTPSGYHIAFSQFRWNINTNTQWYKTSYVENFVYGSWGLELTEGGHTLTLQMRVMYERD